MSCERRRRPKDLRFAPVPVPMSLVPRLISQAPRSDEVRAPRRATGKVGASHEREAGRRQGHHHGPGAPAATAVAIRDGRIAAVGDDHEIRAAEVPGAELIDLGGRTVLPGLIDSHAHALDTGLLRRGRRPGRRHVGRRGLRADGPRRRELRPAAGCTPHAVRPLGAARGALPHARRAGRRLPGRPVFVDVRDRPLGGDEQRRPSSHRGRRPRSSPAARPRRPRRPAGSGTTPRSPPPPASSSARSTAASSRTSTARSRRRPRRRASPPCTASRAG